MTHEAANDDQGMRATGPALREYLDENAESKDSVSHFTNSMARLLADRLDGSPDGLVPEGYVMATQLLLYDCKDTGKNGFTGEPMPRDVTGQPPMMYGLFQVESVRLAREVFGDPFADEVETVYSKIRESMDAAAAKVEEPKIPKLTEEQLDVAFSAIAKGDTAKHHGSGIDKSQAYEVLKRIEGIDPVEAVLDGHPDDIPEEGWVVDSDMELGQSIVINVFRYGKGAEFRKSKDWGDKREEHGVGAIWMRLNDYGEYTITYEDPKLPQSQRDREPYDRLTSASYAPLSFDRADIMELGNGGRILDEKEPLRARNGYGSHVGWTDIDKMADKIRQTAKVSRVTDDRESMVRIVGQLGYAMGMDPQGIATLLETVDRKTQNA